MKRERHSKKQRAQKSLREEDRSLAGCALRAAGACRCQAAPDPALPPGCAGGAAATATQGPQARSRSARSGSTRRAATSSCRSGPSSASCIRSATYATRSERPLCFASYCLFLSRVPFSHFSFSKKASPFSLFLSRVPFNNNNNNNKTKTKPKHCLRIFFAWIQDSRPGNLTLGLKFCIGSEFQGKNNKFQHPLTKNK